MPSISIIIPIYNKADSLENCLSSILNQDFVDFNVIMINDGSTDESGEICDRFANLDERFLANHFENAGVATARNRGISLADGEWITFVDADDWLDSTYLSSIISSISSTPDANIVVNTKMVINENDRVISWDSEIDNQGYFSRNHQKLMVLEKIPVSMCCYTFKRDSLNGALLDPSIHYYEDLDFLLKVCNEKQRFVVNRKGGYHYRQGSYTHSKLTWKTTTSFNMVDKQAQSTLPADISHILEERIIMSVATVGLADSIYNKESNSTLKKRAKQHLKKKPPYKRSGRRSFALRLLSISPKLYYFVHRTIKKLKGEARKQ